VFYLCGYYSCSLTKVDVSEDPSVSTALRCVSVITLEPCEIYGFHGAVFLWNVMLCSVVDGYRRFGWSCCIPGMRFSETWVHIWQTTQRYIPEDVVLHGQCHENFMFRFSSLCPPHPPWLEWTRHSQRFQCIQWRFLHLYLHMDVLFKGGCGYVS
jgi:hypothetical protein